MERTQFIVNVEHVILICLANSDVSTECMGNGCTMFQISYNLQKWICAWYGTN